MSKTIDQILDDTVVPEMEYEPKYEGKTKSKSNARVAVTIDEVPEVVLPKTKAEMYEEAKDRLNEKTSAASVRRERRAAKKPAKAKTVELEIAAVASAAEQTETERIRLRRNVLRAPADEPKWVGGADELVPFAWRNPLVLDIARPNKLYLRSVRAAKETMLPALRDK